MPTRPLPDHHDSLAPLDRLDREWQQLARRELPAALARWSEQEPLLRRFPAPAALLWFLHGSATGWREKDELLAALIRLAHVEPLAGRVVLQALLPGLKALAGRVLFDAREREEVWELLLDHVWERIRSYPLERRRGAVANGILLDTLHATLADRSRERQSQYELTADAVAAAAPSVFPVDVEAPLRRAVTAGALTETEAELILLIRIDGRRLAETAAELGVSYDTARMRLHRAERRLMLFLGRPVLKRREIDHSSSARVSGAHQGKGGATTSRPRR